MTKEEKKELRAELSERLQEGIRDVYASDKYKEFLKSCSRFHRYSVNNTLLILLQNPTASRVASYTTWKKLDRQVKKGEQAIYIWAPCFRARKRKKAVEKTEDSQEDNEDNEVIVYSGSSGFRLVPVFDEGQTEGKPLPELIAELAFSVENYQTIFNTLSDLAPCPVAFAKDDNIVMKTGAKGYFDHVEEEIVLRPGMSQAQTIKTLIHETAHAILHHPLNGLDKEADRRTREVEAESVAFIVCDRLGIDTSEYSFGYLANWSSGKDVKELQKNLDLIWTAAGRILNAFDIVAEDAKEAAQAS